MEVFRPDAKAGAFILGGLALFLFTIFRIGGYMDDLKGGLDLTLVFNDAQQVETGADIYHRGMKVGRVREIGFSPDGAHIHIQARLDQGTKIYPNTMARIIDKSMLGGKIVELVPPAKKDSTTPLPSGSQLQGLPPSGLAATMDKVTSMMDEYKVRIDGLFEKVDTLVTNVNNVAIKTGDGIESLSGIGTTAETTLKDYSTLAKNLEVDIEKMTQDISLLATNTDTRLGTVQEDVQKLTVDLRDKIAQLTTRMDTMLVSTNTLLSTSHTTIEDNRENLMESLESLKRILVQLEDFSEQIAERPSSIVWGRKKKK